MRLSGLLIGASGSDSALSWIVTIAVICGAIALGIWYFQNRAKKIVERESAIRDRLLADGTNPEIVVGALQETKMTDKKGKSSTSKSPCMLTLTESQLIQFGMTDGDRSIIHLVDVAGSTLKSGELSIHVLNGQDRSYGRPLARPEWTKRLADLEEALDRTVSRAKTATRGAQTSVADELSKLAELRDEGVINDSDWERAKNLFLGKPEVERDRAARDLRQLYELQKSGVLSPSEFNMKKWDVLSRTK